MPLQTDENFAKNRVARQLGISEKEIRSFSLHKKSIDARDKSDVHFVCSYVVGCERARLKNAATYIPPADLLAERQNFNACAKFRKHCVVVGSGPSGLFLTRYLTQHGVAVTLIERGSDVEARSKAVKNFFENGVFDPKTNVQFGLGGAGTFSDGKLATGISSPLVNTVFSEFVRCGAPKDILTSATPHIGTDKLVSVVANLRDKILNDGGKILFDTFVSEIVMRNNKACGVNVVDEKTGISRTIEADCVALCCGHSAREMFSHLLSAGVAMRFKPFAVGLRIVHTREFINRTQYGELFATHRDLDAASYKLVNNTDTHSCYSFCMCPGGIVIPANSSPNTVVVNGMSNYLRHAGNSNSALVVSTSEKDVSDYGFGNGVLSGMDFQQYLEEKAYLAGGGDYRAPYQNVTDFLAGKISGRPDVEPDYPRGVTSADFHTILPQRICDVLAESLLVFDKKMKDFAKHGILLGVETRTSSPIKLLRAPDTLQCVNVVALYPVGEGTGHSGGIVSSAVDGLKVAQKILEYFEKS